MRDQTPMEQRTTAAAPVTGRPSSGHGNPDNSGPSHGHTPAAGTPSTHGGALPQRPTSAHRPNPAPAANNAPRSSAEEIKKKEPFQVAQAPLMTENDKPSHEPGLWYEAAQQLIKEKNITG